jgi:hypothetical protein
MEPVNNVWMPAIGRMVIAEDSAFTVRRVDRRRYQLDQD